MHLRRLVLLLLLTPLAWTQSAADIATEPHHHLLMQNAQVRVFSFTLSSGEQAFVRHEHNFLLVTLQDSELAMWGRGEAPVAHFRLPLGDARFGYGDRALGFRNDRSGTYHGIVVEFLDPKITMYGYQYESGEWGFGGGAINQPVDAHAHFVNGMLMGAARALDVQLLAGDSFPPPEKPASELLIPISDVALTNQGSSPIRKSSGDIFWFASGRTAALRNNSNLPARLVDVQIYAEPGK